MFFIVDGFGRAPGLEIDFTSTPILKRLASLLLTAKCAPPEVAEEMMKCPQVAVFDTAFHQTMPAKAYMYALPYELYDTWR